MGKFLNRCENLYSAKKLKGSVHIPYRITRCEKKEERVLSSELPIHPNCQPNGIYYRCMSFYIKQLQNKGNNVVTKSR